MLGIPEIKNLADGMIVDAVQVAVSKVYERRPYDGQHGATTVQNAEFVDAAGNKIRASVWGHPDLASLQGKTVVVHSVKGGNNKLAGVTVKHGSWTPKEGPKQGQPQKTIELTVGKNGQFQLVEVYHQNAGTKPDMADHRAGQAVAGPAPSGQRPINGMTVGMAVNNAVKVLGDVGAYDGDVDEFGKKVYLLASKLIRVAAHLEAGHLASNSKETPKEEKLVDEETARKNFEEAKRQAQIEEDQKRLANLAKPEDLDEDVPF